MKECCSSGHCVNCLTNEVGVHIKHNHCLFSVFVAAVARITLNQCLPVILRESVATHESQKPLEMVNAVVMS